MDDGTPHPRPDTVNRPAANLLESSQVLSRWAAVAKRLLKASHAGVYQVRAAGPGFGESLPDAPSHQAGTAAVLVIPVAGAGISDPLEFRIAGEPGRMWSSSDIATLYDVSDALSSELKILSERHHLLQLEESDEIRKALARASSNIIWTTSVDGSVTASSESWRGFTGQSESDCLGLGWLEAVHPNDQIRVCDHWKAIVQNPVKSNIEYRLRKASGEWRWVSETAVPLFERDGTLKCWSGLTSDIHDRRLEEQRRAASELRYRALVEASSKMTWSMDAEAHVDKDAWAPWCEFTGQNKTDWDQRRWLEVVHPDDRNKMRDQWDSRPSETHTTECEYRLWNTDGSWHWVLERVVPLHGEEGACIGWVGMTSDITVEKKLQLALAESESRYRALVEVSSKIVWTADAKGRFTEDSPSWRNFTGMPESYRQSENWLEAVHPDDRSIVLERWNEAYRSKKPNLTEYRLRRADGKWRWMVGRSAPYKSQTGEHGGWIGMISDNTERKLADLTLAARERHLGLALRAARMAAWSLDFKTGELTIEDEGSGVIGLSGYGLNLQQMVARINPPQIAEFTGWIETIRRGGANSTSEFQINIGDTMSWISISGQMSESSNGNDEILRGIFCDITERKLVEERRNMLVGEIAHRGKNLLAVVQSIASMTLAKDVNPEDAYSKFQGRLASLSRSHSLLTDKDWHGVPFSEIVLLELGTVADRAAINVTSVTLNPSSAQNCALVLHELTTNSLKYGALSCNAGRVAVTGELVFQDGEDCLKFSWKETGGPPVMSPSRKGFGTMLLNRLISGFDSDGKITYEPDGLRLEVAMPLSMIRPTQTALESGS